MPQSKISIQGVGRRQEGQTPAWKFRFRGISEQSSMRPERHRIEVMNHPPMAECDNILSLLGYGWNIDEGSIPFLVTELAPWGTLRQYLKANSGLRGLQKIKFCRDVMNGMSELHLAGVIHGDLKLDNVLVVDGMQARISDFGHSILTSSSPEDLEAGSYRGTEM